MKSTILLVLASFVLFSLSAAQTLPFQSHSFNDVDYIIQQLIKGTLYPSISFSPCLLQVLTPSKSTLTPLTVIHAKLIPLGKKMTTNAKSITTAPKYYIIIFLYYRVYLYYNFFQNTMSLLTCQ